jgi:hypothetical protein
MNESSTFNLDSYIINTLGSKAEFNENNIINITFVGGMDMTEFNYNREAVLSSIGKDCDLRKDNIFVYNISTQNGINYLVAFEDRVDLYETPRLIEYWKVW